MFSRNLSRCLALTAMSIIAACASTSTPPQEAPLQPMPLHEPTDPDEITEPEDDEEEDTEPEDDEADAFGPRNFSEPMTFDATIELTPGGKRGSKSADTMYSWIVRDDGERWLANYGDDLSKYAGQRVRVTGRTYEPSPNVAHLVVTHFELQTIEASD